MDSIPPSEGRHHAIENSPEVRNVRSQLEIFLQNKGDPARCAILKKVLNENRITPQSHPELMKAVSKILQEHAGSLFEDWRRTTLSRITTPRPDSTPSVDRSPANIFILEARYEDALFLRNNGVDITSFQNEVIQALQQRIQNLPPGKHTVEEDYLKKFHSL